MGAERGGAVKSTEAWDAERNKLIPNCVAFDPFQVKTYADIRYILQHEIDLFEEGEDGALSEKEIKTVRKALKFVEVR